MKSFREFLSEDWRKVYNHDKPAVYHSTTIGPHKVNVYATQVNKARSILGFKRPGAMEIGFDIDGQTTRKGAKVDPKHKREIIQHVKHKAAQITRQSHRMNHDVYVHSTGSTKDEVNSKDKHYGKFFHDLNKGKKF